MINIMISKATLLSLCITFCFAILTLNSKAQIAPNDNCGGAIALTPITPSCIAGANFQTGDVSGASQTFAGCSGVADDDVWYTFTTTATANQPYCITVVGSASFDAVFQVFSGSCGGTSVICTNSTGVGGMETSTLIAGVQLAVSTIYWIRIYDAGAGFPATTTFDICITIPPVNDDCTNATSLSPGNPCSNCTPTAGTLNGATASSPPNVCGGVASDDVWYTFTATATSHIVTVTPCAGLDPVIQAYADSCGSGNTIGCMNSFGQGITETMTLTGLTIGSMYWIRIYDFTGSSVCSTFLICIQTPPTNDDCPGAISLSENITCVPTTGCDSNATNSGIPVSSSCNASNPDDDVWYSFIANGTMAGVDVTASSTFDPCFEIFDGTCGAFNSILCNAPGGVPGTTIFSCFPTIVGTQYYLRVYDFNAGYPPTSSFSICVSVCSGVGVTAMNNEESGIIIYPNPFTSQTTISFSEEQKHTTIIITDVLGKEIKTINFSGKQCIIEKGEMSNGIYFVRIEDEKKNVINRKIIIQ